MTYRIFGSVVLCILFFLLHIALVEYATDDAYIHFRIAENFLNSGSPYFNRGEAVMASSSPLWTIILTLFLVFSKATQLPWMVATFNSILMVLMVIASRDLVAKKFPSSRFLLELAAFAPIAVVLTASIQLMETPFAMLLVIGGFLCLPEKLIKAVLLFTVAMWVRIECIVFLLVCLLYIFKVKREMILKSLGCAVLVSLPVLFYMLYFFGTVVPNTVKAKKIIYSLSYTETVVLVALEYFGKLIFYSQGVATFIFGFVILASVLCYFFLVRKTIILENAVTGLILSGGLLVLAAYILQRVFIFPWYAPIYSLPIILGVLLAREGRYKIFHSTICMLVLLPGGVTLFLTMLAAAQLPEYFSEFESGAKVRQYRYVARRLYSACPDCSLMAAEIGGIGYEFKGHIYDAAGLAAPDALPHHERRAGKSAAMDGAIPASYAAEKSPQLILGLDVHLREILTSGLAEQYEVKKLPIFLKEDEPLIKAGEYLKSKHLNLLVHKDNREVLRELAF